MKKTLNLIIAILALLLLASCSQSGEVKLTTFKYKARSLENNQSIVIWDRLALNKLEAPYAVGDTVPVNMSTSKIDHKDSVSMYCVIEKEFIMPVDTL